MKFIFYIYILFLLNSMYGQEISSDLILTTMDVDNNILNKYDLGQAERFFFNDISGKYEIQYRVDGAEYWVYFVYTTSTRTDLFKIPGSDGLKYKIVDNELETSFLSYPKDDVIYKYEIIFDGSN